MEAKRYHIGKNGPAVCNAHPERPGGRACRLGGPDGTERHGTLADVTVLWEREQEVLHSSSLLSGLSRAVVPEPSEPKPESPEALKARSTLSNPAKYAPSDSTVSYGKDERTVAINLALESFSALSHTPVVQEDHSWESDGFSSVHRYELADGSMAYFKPFTMNSFEEGDYSDYGTSSLGASINEVNSYRLAQALGDGFSELVPETVFREINGELGTLQREVEEDSSLSANFATVPGLKEDYRKAAIFDFVAGSLDRHKDNYLYGLTKDGGYSSRKSIRLIDNSFSFPDRFKHSHFNSSIFATNRGIGNDYDENGRWIELYNIPPRELRIRADERSALTQARGVLQGWIDAKTIAQGSGEKALARIDHLLRGGKVVNLSEYLSAL